MDPLTQGVVGAAFSLTSSTRQTMAQAATVGALAGMAPDLDVFIRSSTDPLLALEYHRHFTHSFAFVPIGALLVTLALYPLLGKRWHMSFKQCYLWSAMGYATHALLDVCTSYGTQVFWPFSHMRLSIDTISVIDPLFTLPLLILLLIAIWQRSKNILSAGILWAACYLSFGVLQHSRAINAGHELATKRGHTVERLHAKPSFANLVVWKTIYESGNDYHVDAVRLWFGPPSVWQGDSVAKLQLPQDFPWLQANSRQAADIERFRWFSDGFLAVDSTDANRIVDIRYSLVPNEIQALWGITLNEHASPEQHVKYVSMHRNADDSAVTLWKMIRGQYSNDQALTDGSKQDAPAKLTTKENIKTNLLK